MNLHRAVLMLAVLAPAVAAQAPKSCVVPDTTLPWFRWPQTDSAPSVDSLERMERELASAGLSNARAAGLLLALGRGKSFLPVDSSYAVKYPQEYFRDEISAQWMYTGWHFDELSRRFPDSDLADDAMYEETLLPQGGECEGFTACYVAVLWGRLAGFLGTHPESPRADAALSRVLLAFSVLKEDMDLVNPPDEVELPEVRRYVAQLDSVARIQRPHLQAVMLARAAELWAQMGEMPRARLAYQAAQALRDPDLDPCLARRLAVLPRAVLHTERPRVIHPKRVELFWQRIDSVQRYEVKRSASRDDAGAIIGSFGPYVTGWTDTTAAPGTHWYRVIAIGRDSIAGLPTRADVPSWGVRPSAAAVSRLDGRLFIRGELANGLPQLLRISADGSRVERSTAATVSEVRRGVAAPFWPHLREVVLMSANGLGVMTAPVGSRSDPFVRVRAAIVAGAANIDSASVRHWPEVIEAVDDATRRVRFARLHDDGIRLSQMDCIDAAAVCWLAGEKELQLRHDNGAVLARAQLPAGGMELRPTAVYADPTDRSVWVFLMFARRLLHLDASGVARHDIQLGDGKTWVQAFTIDFPQRAAYFLAGGPTASLVRIDLASPALRQDVLAPAVTAATWILPDSRGGLWFVGRNSVQHRDAQGRFTSPPALAGILGVR